jgi:hypothetical protein
MIQYLDIKALLILLLMRFAFVLLIVVPFHIAVDIVVCDASFISLQTVLPPAMSLVKRNGILICLVKPQVSQKPFQNNAVIAVIVP